MNKATTIKPYTLQEMKELKARHFLYFVSIHSIHPMDESKDMTMLIPFKDIFEAKQFAEERVKIFNDIGEKLNKNRVKIKSIQNFKILNGVDYRIAYNSDYYKNEKTYPLLGLN